MNYVEAIVLAVLQGATEFLPVSSSGHLVLAQHWFGHFNESSLLYDVMLHLATAAAIVTYFRNDLMTLFKGFLGQTSSDGGIFAGAERRTILYIILASIPTAIIGLSIERIGITVLSRPDIVGTMLILTGVILWVGRSRVAQRTIQEMKISDALTIGLIQGFAVLPGISRSGSTIAGGLWLGLDRELSARFSLLISLPAILGATGLELVKAMGQVETEISLFVMGMVIASLVGYVSISIILRLVRQDHFYRFSYYLWPIGCAVIFWTHFH